MSGGNTSKATEKTEPWSAQIPGLKYSIDEATRIYNGPATQYYPGSTVAGFSPEQQQAQQLGTQRATSGNQTMNMAEGYAQDVLGGKYLNSNPYQDQVFQNVQQKVMPAVNSKFSNSGRYGSGMHGVNLTDQLTTSYAPYASQIYQSERANQQAAMNFAPQFAAQDWTDINALNNIGAQKQGLAQNELNDAIARWDFNQAQPGERLDQFIARISGNYGGTSTTKKPNPGLGQTLLGGLFGAAGTAADLGWQPFA